ncbi:hypothetical protein HN011_007917 [Eciton burchellii]|nr:hypothetical protein HN011_007917 [Eciton burchellii]
MVVAASNVICIIRSDPTVGSPAIDLPARHATLTFDTAVIAGSIAIREPLEQHTSRRSIFRLIYKLPPNILAPCRTGAEGAGSRRQEAPRSTSSTPIYKRSSA